MIRFEQNKVYRRVTKSSKLVCDFLKYIYQQGFNKVPKCYGIDKDEYVLSYINGEIYNLDYPIVNKNMLISSAKLLREYHDISEKFIQSNLMQEYGWMLNSISPIQVICHNDFASYNICYDKNQAIGLIDFETAAPGPRIWDIAYSLYRFAPFMISTKHEDFGTIDEQMKRARLFCSAYGLIKRKRVELTDIIINRLESLLNFMMRSAKESDAKYIKAIQEGHHLKYIKDIEYIKLNKNIINRNLNEK